MTVSMTGYATRRGTALGQDWVWDIRSVNGKGLDLRLRLPDGIEGLEAAVRAEAGRAMTRGNVSLSLKIAREAGSEGVLTVNRGVLGSVLAALSEVEAAAMAQGVTLAQATQAEVLAVRGVLEVATEAATDTGALRTALLDDLAPLLADFAANRAAEGAALAAVLARQLEEIAALVSGARCEAEARRDTTATTLRQNLARVMADAAGADEGRVAQELALIAVKSDVSEEIDRLTAHIAAARALLAESAPVGRKFDFLTQEFMREANTLCSKAQSMGLTRIGLDLKTVIDQMREQVANVE